MTVYDDRQIIPYSPEQLFDMVADVGKYPQFLPWCVAARVKSQSATELVADMTIGFGPFRETFTSRVQLDRPRLLTVKYENGPFKYMNNTWRFSPEARGTRVDFHVEFEFRSRLLQRAIGVVFNEAVRRMVGAFKTRARQLYGPPGATVSVTQPEPVGS